MYFPAVIPICSKCISSAHSIPYSTFHINIQTLLLLLPFLSNQDRSLPYKCFLLHTVCLPGIIMHFLLHRGMVLSTVSHQCCILSLKASILCCMYTEMAGFILRASLPFGSYSAPAKDSICTKNHLLLISHPTLWINWVTHGNRWNVSILVVLCCIWLKAWLQYKQDWTLKALRSLQHFPALLYSST